MRVRVIALVIAVSGCGEPPRVDVPRSPWSLRTPTDALYGIESQVLTVYGEYGIRLVVACEALRLRVHINWNRFVSNDLHRLVWRLDDGELQEGEWYPSTDGHASFRLPDDTSFVQSLLDHDRLVIRVVPENRSPVTASFRIAGLRGSIQPLLAGCRLNL